MTSLDDLPIRLLTPADLTACLDLAEENAWEREEHRWRLLLTSGQGYGIDASADDPAGGLVAAVIRTSYADQWHAVGMMLVARQRQRQGLGQRMMRRVIGDAAGAPVLLTATDQGRGLYERLGFKAVGGITTVRGTFVPPPGPAGADGVTVRPATAADLPAILAYDRPAFGADRTELLARLPSFADRFLVAVGPGGRLVGYGAAWPNVTSTSVGPLVADDPAVARALLTPLALDTPTRARFDVGDWHPELAAWLAERGLVEAARTELMIHGAAQPPGDLGRRYAPFSMAHG
ncbi:GNAT family N-acetyltransferase [Streptomyces sp. 3MP-14]|uniref:GNAT family N-acetyltransferase n=1 Tax=Streptomyces mimosae TaxID=2586635 RepID=A0A5N6A3Q8_9ACTN|nr:MULTISPECIES: GNAT family N-acetyltransferase [Streptomyces]KAB8163301.1 GNAT family N-acetyltransferase [Streptomyces mimosae]KAB8174578.1 GNAT family N-acetyltransferase [Streptomyces sp. 3MP-14]